MFNKNKSSEIDEKVIRSQVSDGNGNAADNVGILSDISDKRDAVAAEKKRRKKLTKQIVLPIVGVLLFVFVLNMVILPLTGSCARVGAVDTYDGDNQYIAIGRENGTMLSAHRAGGDLAPEETLSAFKLCMESTEYRVDIVEFDLHLTKDGHLVLMHDHEVDRTSDGEKVFGKSGVKIQDKTLAELKTLNFGYNFQSPDGSYPYRNIENVPDDVRILTLDEVLTYLKSMRPDGDLNYIIEIKDKGSVGKEAMDKLFEAMEAYEITDRTIVGTFNGDITKYIDDTYGGRVKRSAGILEVLNFYYAFLWGVKQNPDKLGYDVLQIPMGLNNFYDFGTKEFIDYAHSLGIAVQYWTINEEEDLKKLIKNGADAIMTDNPELAYNVAAEMNSAGTSRW